MQGVLNYEERLQPAREEVRIERMKLEATVKDLQFWQARAKELEGRLHMYEGRKGKEDPQIGCSGNQSDTGVRDVRGRCMGQCAWCGGRSTWHGGCTGEYRTFT